jgi:hypothetical protein
MPRPSDELFYLFFTSRSWFGPIIPGCIVYNVGEGVYIDVICEKKTVKK